MHKNQLIPLFQVQLCQDAKSNKFYIKVGTKAGFDAIVIDDELGKCLVERKTYHAEQEADSANWRLRHLQSVTGQKVRETVSKHDSEPQTDIFRNNEV